MHKLLSDQTSRTSGCQYSGYMHSVNIYAEQLIDGDCMENSRRRLQRWALDTVNIQSECIKKTLCGKQEIGRLTRAREGQLMAVSGPAAVIILLCLACVSSAYCYWLVVLRTEGWRLFTSFNYIIKPTTRHAVCVRVYFAVQWDWFPPL